MKQQTFTIRGITNWCNTCESEVKTNDEDAEVCWVCGSSLSVIIGDEVNPHPSQILTLDLYGNVITVYVNPAYEKWEKENGNARPK